MGEDTDASPGDSSHTDPSQVDPNVESTPDCLLVILHSLAQLTLRGIYLTMKACCLDGPHAVTKGVPTLITGINNVIRHFDFAFYCRVCFVHLHTVMCFVCAQLCLTFNLKQQGWNGVIINHEPLLKERLLVLRRSPLFEFESWHLFFRQLCET